MSTNLLDKTGDKSHRDSISLPVKEVEIAKKKVEAEKKKKSYSLWDFMKFTLPYLWKGGFWIRV